MPQQTLTDVSFDQSTGQSVLRFTKLLNEDGERPIDPNGLNQFIWAYGSSTDFGFHAVRGVAPLPSLSTCQIVGADGNANANNAAPDFVAGEIREANQSKYTAHAWLMGIAWALLAPLAIGCSMLRYLLFKENPIWFKLHMFLNGTAFLLTTAAFGIIVHEVKLSSPDGKANFGLNKHRKIGLAVYVMVCAQVLMGILRPHTASHAASHPDGEGGEDAEKAENGGDGDKDGDDAGPQKSVARRAFEVVHPVFGFAMLGLAWYNCDIGIAFYALRFPTSVTFNADALLWGVIGGFGGLILVLYAVQFFVTGEW